MRFFIFPVLMAFLGPVIAQSGSALFRRQGKTSSVESAPNPIAEQYPVSSLPVFFYNKRGENGSNFFDWR